MIERIQELSNDQIDKLKALGQDSLTAISPTVAAMVYSDSPDQLQALRNIGPDSLGAMSPQLADMLYGDDGYGGGAVGPYDEDGYGGGAVGTYGDDEDQYGGGAVGDYGNDDYFKDGDKTILPWWNKKKKHPPIILPPFPIPPGGGYQPDPGEYVSWNVDPSLNNCQTCLDNSDDDPRPYGEPFSSGDTEPPIHPRCGCFLTNSMRGSCPIHGYGNDRIFELSSRF